MLTLKDHIQIAATLGLNLKTLLRSPFWNVEQTQAYQLKHLRARLADAKNVSHYNNLPAAEEIQTLSDWNKVPILTKQKLLSHPIQERLNPKYKVKNLIEAKSSGSTGVPLNIYYDKNCFFYHMLVEIRFFLMNFHYRPWHKQTYIYTAPHAYKSLMGFFPRKFLSTLTPIETIIEALRNNPPDVLVSYPSSLRAIVDQMTKEDLMRIRPKVIGVNSEMSSAKEREYISKKFNAPIFDDYSSEELIWIAAQCKEHQYHIFDDINYVEVVDDQHQPVPDGTVGNIVGTNLLNRAMPFLRYMQGDRGSIRKSTCACGRSFKILEKLEGRRNDTFILPNGKLLSPGYLLDLTDTIFFKYTQAVRAFRLVQDTLEQWTVEIVPGEHWHSHLENAIQQDFVQIIKQPLVNIQTKMVNEIRRSASGKYLPIVSHVMREKLKKSLITPMPHL